MDNAQFPKTGGTWTNRVQMIVSREPAWVTVPIVRAYHGTRSVREMRIHPNSTWRGKLMRTLEHSYRRATHFAEVHGWLEELVLNPTSDLAEYNLNAIHAVCDRLEFKTPFRIGSALGADGQATDLLISMVKAVGGTAYLVGGGASGYQQDENFAEAGINLIHQDFQHPTYPQLNTTGFQPGLSIVDALMNCGFAGTAELLERAA